MGGCRCAYKNCTLRTDGVTHMFHFPVFDKVRCHQWLTNAGKPEFLNLKVSQLKNRVICQHHFKPDNFMNFRKDKLTFDAVPTEDGPYCDSSQLTDRTITQDESKMYTISLEDIENEYLTFNDKKANFSVKYGDFLTNCDMMDLDSFNLVYDNPQQTKKEKSEFEVKIENILNDSASTMLPVDVKSCNEVDAKSDNIYTMQIPEIPNEVQVINCANSIPQDKESGVGMSNKQKDPPKRKTGKSMAIDRRITILNEQKISEPVPFPQKLELVCPNTILPLPNKKKYLNANQSVSNDKHNTTINLVAPVLVDPEPNHVLEQAISGGIEIQDVTILKSPEKSNNTYSLVELNSEVQPEVKPIMKTVNVVTPKAQGSIVNRVNTKKSNSLLKNKLPPEKKAAIEEKRKFNIKLRDIITSCLDKLDDQENKDYSSKLKSQIDNNITQKVTSYLAKEPELPSVQDYTVAYLEARMKKMENILLNKIDQNTQRIVEMKHLLSPAPGKRAVHTQTAVSEEVQKKHLYKEISKYLSPEANSLLYEELFINQYVEKLPQKSSAKKRKYR